MVLTGSTFISRQHTLMHVCDHSPSFRNHRFGICDRHVGIDCQLRLKGACQVRERPTEPTNRTYVEDVKDPDKVLLPSCDLVLIAFGKDESIDRAPFTLLNHLPLHLGQCSAIKLSVSGSLWVHMNGLAYTVSSPIASRTDWLSWSNCFPFNFR
jgi:hypothetical protein